MVPAGSKCLTGLRESLPSRRAVSSPRRWASAAWLNSCTVMPMRRAKPAVAREVAKTKTNRSGSSNRRSIFLSITLQRGQFGDAPIIQGAYG